MIILDIFSSLTRKERKKDDDEIQFIGEIDCVGASFNHNSLLVAFRSRLLSKEVDERAFASINSPTRENLLQH